MLTKPLSWSGLYAHPLEGSDSRLGTSSSWQVEKFDNAKFLSQPTIGDLLIWTLVTTNTTHPRIEV